VATLGHPQQNPLHYNVLGTSKGRWLIRVNAVMAAEESDNLALQLVLRNLEEDSGAETRRLYAVVHESHLNIPQERVLIADRIRQWIETTHGNGFLDLASRM
jgi:predicted ABC-type ATPase